MLSLVGFDAGTGVGVELGQCGRENRVQGTKQQFDRQIRWETKTMRAGMSCG